MTSRVGKGGGFETVTVIIFIIIIVVIMYSYLKYIEKHKQTKNNAVHRKSIKEYALAIEK